MSGYFGTDRQRHLQAIAEASVAHVAETPGACQPGRFMGCDEPDRLGWDRIDAILDREGIFGFRMIPAERADEIRSRLAGRGSRMYA